MKLHKRVPTLNDEEWLKIFSYLDEKDKKNALKTCKRWCTLIKNDPKLSGYLMVYFDLTSYGEFANSTATIIPEVNSFLDGWPALK